jgi:hypothetical protein
MKAAAIAVATAFFVIVGVADAIAQVSSHIDQAIDEWARKKLVGIAPEVRSDLTSRALEAVKKVHKDNPDVPERKLVQLLPAAVVLYLDNTQSSGKSPKIAALLEELATSQIPPTASGLGSLNDFPILTIDVMPPTPKDFVVVINGIAYQAGLDVFRVSGGSKTVKVVRTNRERCSTTIEVTQAGPNRFVCNM